MIKKILITTFIIVIISIFIGTAYFLYKKSEEPAVTFETDSLFVTDIVLKTIATGTIKPRKEVEIKSQVSGVVEKLFGEPGDKVETGTLIAKIRIIPNVVALNNAEANAKSARINFKNAEIELQMQKSLFEQNLISELGYNQYLLTYNLRKQEMESAENNLELVREGASKKSGTVSNLVTATVNGMLLEVPVKEGSFVIESNPFNDGTSIATIANMSEMIFEGSVDETDVGKLNLGMELNLKIGALGEKNFYANLEYISPKGNEEEGAIKFQIRAAIEIDDSSFLRAGYSANADIVMEKKESVLAIKESNVMFEGDKTFVEVEVGEQQFERREIQTGISDGINIEIVSGLAHDEKIKKIF